MEFSFVVAKLQAIPKSGVVGNLCIFLLKHCKDICNNNDIMDIFAPAVQRILKHNMVSLR